MVCSRQLLEAASPYAAAGHWSTAYDPDECRDPVSSPERETPFSGRLMDPAPASEDGMRKLQAQYYGMISDVDNELGRLVRHARVAWHVGRHLVVVTSDHGEQLGDQGLLGKGGMFESELQTSSASYATRDSERRRGGRNGA